METGIQFAVYFHPTLSQSRRILHGMGWYGIVASALAGHSRQLHGYYQAIRRVLSAKPGIIRR